MKTIQNIQINKKKKNLFTKKFKTLLGKIKTKEKDVSYGLKESVVCDFNFPHIDSG